MRRESRQKRVREKASNRGLSNDFLEPDEDDEGGVSIAAIKNHYKKRQTEAIYSSDDDESDIETGKAKRLEKAKRAIRESDDDSEASRSGSEGARSGSESGGGKSESEASDSD